MKESLDPCFTREIGNVSNFTQIILTVVSFLRNFSKDFTSKALFTISSLNVQRWQFVIKRLSNNSFHFFRKEFLTLYNIKLHTQT